jgi:hypothetical protein
MQQKLPQMFLLRYQQHQWLQEESRSRRIQQAMFQEKPQIQQTLQHQMCLQTLQQGMLQVQLRIRLLMALQQVQPLLLLPVVKLLRLQLQRIQQLLLTL